MLYYTGVQEHIGKKTQRVESLTLQAKFTHFTALSFICKELSEHPSIQVQENVLYIQHIQD